MKSWAWGCSSVSSDLDSLRWGDISYISVGQSSALCTSLKSVISSGGGLYCWNCVWLWQTFRYAPYAFFDCLSCFYLHGSFCASLESYGWNPWTRMLSEPVIWRKVRGTKQTPGRQPTLADHPPFHRRWSQTFPSGDHVVTLVNCVTY